MHAGVVRPFLRRGEMDLVRWYRKLPIVSLLLVGTMGYVALGGPGDLRGDSGESFDAARAEARAYFERNPQLAVDRLGELMLDPAWLEAARAAAPSPGGVELPARMRARSQRQLESLIDTAYQAKLADDPAWRHGVLDARTPRASYLTHAFVHDAMAGLLLTLAVLLIAGAPLERTWGSLVYGAFALAAIPVTALAYRFLDASGGVPWSGGAGLAGAVLGAYFIRGLGGHFLVPGWMLLPAWLGVEAFAVRGFWLDDLGGVPWASLIAGVGLGALVAGTLRLLGVERRLDAAAARRADRAPHPVVARAARLRSDGDPYQAFDLIQAAWRETPGDRELAETFFAIAVEVEQPDAAAEAIVPSLRAALRRGDVGRALDWWLPLATREIDVDLEATVAVRLGEALLDGGHPTEAVFSLRMALDAGASAALATRIVKIARDLDDDLARRAAQIALADPTVDPRIRDDLHSLAAPSAASLDRSETETEPEPAPPSRDQLDRRVRAEHQPIETTAFPLGSDEDLESTEDTEDLLAADANEQSLMAQALDRGAFTAEGLAAGDVRSLEHELAGGGLLSTEDLESIQGDPLAGLPELGDALDDPRDAETDNDMTPQLDATDELTSPLGADAFELGIDGEGASEPAAVPLRGLKALDAVPIAAGPDWIEIDVDERGKSRLPLTRIQALAVGAVSGLAARPVLVVDFALNWVEDPAEPLKVIRLRSDRFDPQRFASSAEGPLAALVAWIRTLQAGSGARCLPSRELLEGRFQRFETLEAYECEVLVAASR